jgi:hypothetical protein
MRRAAKRDATEPAIIDALQRAGCRVQPLSQDGVPDLLVRGPKGWALLEVKSPGGRLTPAQRQWRQTYGVVPIVQTPDEAIRAVLGG